MTFASAVRQSLTGLAVMAVCTSALAIKYGELDCEGHPNVGLMVALDGSGNPMWRCSGTLVSPTIYLTAGHCTDGAARVTIWFDADVESGLIPPDSTDRVERNFLRWNPVAGETEGQANVRSSRKSVSKYVL